MTSEEFDVIVAKRIQLIREVLLVKAGEYASAWDRLHNFKAGAALSGQVKTPAEVCLGFALKHWVSICDLVAEVAQGDTKKIPLAPEKIGDAINYLILLEALIAEQSRGQ